MSSHKSLAIPIEVVPRHVHLSPTHWRALFGKGAEVHVRAALSQRGQVVLQETVRVVGPEGAIDEVFVFGPCRKDTQVELSTTDALAIGVEAPERVSGDHHGSEGCRLIGPNGEVVLKRGTIIPLPHLHLSDRAAAQQGLRQGSLLDLDILGEAAFVLPRVVVRVHPTFQTALHVSSDHAARFWLPTASYARI